MVASMRVEDLVERLEPFVRDRLALFMGVEEMKALGYNIINFVLDLGVDVEYAAISFRYLPALDELEPIAVVIQPKKDKLKDLDLQRVLSAVRSYGGYVYGSYEGMGFLIPVNEENLYDMLSNGIANLLSLLFGRYSRPYIIGYTLDISTDG